jgi:hypothetical protein
MSVFFAWYNEPKLSKYNYFFETNGQKMDQANEYLLYRQVCFDVK